MKVPGTWRACGPLRVSDISGDAHPLCPRLHRSRRGSPACPSPPTSTAPVIEGVGFYQITTRNGLRLSVARAFLGGPRRRTNLRDRDPAHWRPIRLRRSARGRRRLCATRPERQEARAAAEIILGGGRRQFPAASAALWHRSGRPCEFLRDRCCAIGHSAVGQQPPRPSLPRPCLPLPGRRRLNEELQQLAGQVMAALRYASVPRRPARLRASTRPAGSSAPRRLSEARNAALFLHR